MVERLVQHPSLQVHSWHLKADSTVSTSIRNVLVAVRELGISNVILLTSSRETTNLVLLEVCISIQFYIVVLEYQAVGHFFFFFCPLLMLTYMICIDNSWACI